MDSKKGLNKKGKPQRIKVARCSRCGHACPSCNAPAHQKPPVEKVVAVTSGAYKYPSQQALEERSPPEAPVRAAAGSSHSSSEVTVTVKAEPVEDCLTIQQAPVPSPAPSARAVWVPTPLDVTTVIRPPGAGDKGQGQPLAPPGWQWGVGVRRMKCGTQWRDRILVPSQEFLAKYGGKRERLRSKLQLKNYIEKFHPTVSFQDVLRSFVWHIPA